MHWVVAVGAMTAMLGVLLNLILGLSRVVLAMGRRRDMPAAVARLNASRTTPYVAVTVVGLAVAGLAASGSVTTTWTFSAFTVMRSTYSARVIFLPGSVLVPVSFWRSGSNGASGPWAWVA